MEKSVDQGFQVLMETVMQSEDHPFWEIVGGYKEQLPNSRRLKEALQAFRVREFLRPRKSTRAYGPHSSLISY